jgi:hypothetical protein
VISYLLYYDDIIYIIIDLDAFHNNSANLLFGALVMLLLVFFLLATVLLVFPLSLFELVAA